MREPTLDLVALIRDTVREAMRSWRLPATLVLGVGFGVLESEATQRDVALLFGPFAALYTLKASHYRPDACPMCKSGEPLENAG